MDKDEAARSNHTGVFAIEIPSQRGLEVRKPMFEAVAPEAEGPMVPQNTVFTLLKAFQNRDSLSPLVRGASNGMQVKPKGDQSTIPVVDTRDLFIN